MVGAGSNPVLLCVLALFSLAVMFNLIANKLPTVLLNEGVVMGKLSFLVVSFFQVSSNVLLGLGVNATGTWCTSLT